MVFDLELPAGCPSADVNEFIGIAYRIVRDNPPTNGDLLTYLELDLLPNANKCLRASISLFSTLDQARHLLDMRPYLGDFVASISLTKAHGRVSKPSNTGHINWWPYAGMRKPADLKVVR